MDADVEVVAPAQSLLAELAESMRPADALECEALGLTPLEAVLNSVRASEWSAVVLINEHVAAAFGTTPPEAATLLSVSRRAGAWLLTSTLVDAYPLRFWRAAKDVLRLMHEYSGADVLWNVVDVRHTRALRFLDALGFEFGPAEPLGVAGEAFQFVWHNAEAWASHHSSNSG